jgi:hypothetical protein
MGSDGLHIKVADARRFVNASTKKYDVIVADLFHPARDGAGSLYTAEHFSSIRSRLNSGGIFCQWLPLYQMDLGIVRVIVRTFLQVFPEGKAYLAHFSLQTPILGLIAGTGPIALNEDWMSHRVNDPALYRELKALRLHDSFALFGCFLAGPEELEQFAGSGPINTDDHPVVIFEAPRFVYSQQDPAYVRLLGLIDRFEPSRNTFSIAHQPIQIAVCIRAYSLTGQPETTLYTPGSESLRPGICERCWAASVSPSLRLSDRVPSLKPHTTLSLPWHKVCTRQIRKLQKNCSSNSRR